MSSEDAIILRRSINEALEQLWEAAGKLKMILRGAGLDIEQELKTIGVRVDQDFVDQFRQMDDKLADICRVWGLGREINSTTKICNKNNVVDNKVKVSS